MLEGLVRQVYCNAGRRPVGCSNGLCAAVGGRIVVCLALENNSFGKFKYILKLDGWLA